MQGVAKITLAVTPEMAGLVREAVRRGGYATASKVFRDALRLWQEGLASGPAEEGAAIFERLRRRWGQGTETGA
jgi:antitoxin ParD1/3/4